MDVYGALNDETKHCATYLSCISSLILTKTIIIVVVITILFYR